MLGRRTQTARDRRDALHPHTGAARAAKVEPRRRPPRDQRLGCGRSAGGRDGGSAETGPREASCESRGSRRRPRSPGCCVGEAAPGSRYGGGSGPRPGVGRGGRRQRRPGARAGRDGNNAPPWRARASMPVNKAWRARAWRGWGRRRTGSSGLALGSAGAGGWKARGPGRSLCAEAGPRRRAVENLVNFGAAAQVARCRPPPGSRPGRASPSRVRGESGRSFWW